MLTLIVRITDVLWYYDTTLYRGNNHSRGGQSDRAPPPEPSALNKVGQNVGTGSTAAGLLSSQPSGVLMGAEEMKMLFTMHSASTGVGTDGNQNNNTSSSSSSAPESHMNPTTDVSNSNNNNNNNNNSYQPTHHTSNNPRLTLTTDKTKATKKKTKKGGATLKQDVAALLSFEFNPDRKGGITKGYRPTMVDGNFGVPLQAKEKREQERSAYAYYSFEGWYTS